MDFYFIQEDGRSIKVSGSINEHFYNVFVELTEKEPHHSGFIGVIDKGKIRATLAVNQYRGKFRNAVYDFVRKYRALEVLEKLAEVHRIKL